MDWSVGEYELTAAQLRPAAKILVDLAAPKPGELVVDVGCGTGNAALLAAVAGAKVIGVDPAARLLEVARGRAAGEGVDVAFVEGTGEAIPLDDGVADVVISAFGVMFSPDVPSAVAELDRVTAPGGRILVTLFPPEGPMMRVMGAAFEELARVLPQPPESAEPHQFGWHVEADVRTAFEPRGFDVTVTRHQLPMRAASVQGHLERLERHPSALASLEAIPDSAVREEVAERIHRRTADVLESVNEDPDAFQITTTFTVAAIRRT